MIFVDTSGWFARYTPSDSFHHTARSFLQRYPEPLLTTDYVVDETLTLFKARGNYERALLLGPQLLAGQLADLVWVEPSDVLAAWNVFERFHDKQWSFTDCVSYVIIQRLRIERALAFDEHFRQFGIVDVALSP